MELMAPHGGKQLLTARKEMLDAFDAAKEKAKSHEVEVFHGRFAEAEFRRWLLNFLPQRFGVTAGYVVSTAINNTQRLPHFDVIIYDKLEAPVLWIEKSPDISPQGCSRAIPVEFVSCVLEIKASLSTSTMKDAIDHLNDLGPLMSGLDATGERYKRYLPSNFHCGVVFFELKTEHQFSKSILKEALVGAQKLRQFFGGIILRGEDHQEPLTGRLMFTWSTTSSVGSFANGKTSLLHNALSESVQVEQDKHRILTLFWAQSYFAVFAFDLIAIMQGKFETGRLSSLHGLITRT